MRSPLDGIQPTSVTPEQDAALSRCWTQWLVAREVGDQEWKRAALNDLRAASEDAWKSVGGFVAEDILRT